MNKMKQIAAFTDIFRVDVYCIGSWLDYDEGMAFCSYLRSNWCGIAILRQKAKRAFCVG